MRYKLANLSSRMRATSMTRYVLMYASRCEAISSTAPPLRSEEHTSELQSRSDLVCRLLLEKKNHTLLAGHLVSLRGGILLRIHQRIPRIGHAARRALLADIAQRELDSSPQPRPID